MGSITVLFIFLWKAQVAIYITIAVVKAQYRYKIDTETTKGTFKLNCMNKKQTYNKKAQTEK